MTIIKLNTVTGRLELDEENKNVVTRIVTAVGPADAQLTGDPKRLTIRDTVYKDKLEEVFAELQRKGCTVLIDGLEYHRLEVVGVQKDRVLLKNSPYFHFNKLHLFKSDIKSDGVQVSIMIEGEDAQLLFGPQWFDKALTVKVLAMLERAGASTAPNADSVRHTGQDLQGLKVF